MKHFIWKLQSYSIENPDKVVKKFLFILVFLSLSFVVLSSLNESLLAYCLAGVSLFVILAALFFLGVVVYTYSFSLKKLKKKVLPDLIKKLKLKGDEKILDLESFRGMLPTLLAKQLSSGKVDCMIRPSTKKFGLKQIKKKIKRKKMGDKIEASELNLSKLPFPDNHFDIVTSSFFFHKILIKEEETLIEEMLRVLKPNGQFVLFDLVSRRARLFNKLVKKGLRSKLNGPLMYFLTSTRAGLYILCESESASLEFSSRTLTFECYLKYSREGKVVLEVEDCPDFVGSRIVWGKNTIMEADQDKS